MSLQHNWKLTTLIDEPFNIAIYNFKHVIMSGKQSYTQRGTEKGVTEGVKEGDIEKDRHRHYK